MNIKIFGADCRPNRNSACDLLRDQQIKELFLLSGDKFVKNEAWTAVGDSRSTFCGG